MRVQGDFRPGDEFRMTSKPNVKAASTFVALTDSKAIVTHYAEELFELPPETNVIAHWHGEWRTAAFLLTVGELKKKAEKFMQANARG